LKLEFGWYVKHLFFNLTQFAQGRSVVSWWWCPLLWKVRYYYLISNVLNSVY